MFVDNSVDMERLLSDKERGGDEILGVREGMGSRAHGEQGLF